jgi:hypothetical protein
MGRRERILSTLKIGSAILSFCFWMCSTVLWYRYAFTLPSEPQPAAGRVQPLNTHGALVHLTAREHFVMYLFMAIGFGFLVLTLVLYGLQKHLEHELPRTMHQ